MRRAVRWLTVLAGSGLVAGAVGFAWFVHVVSRPAPAPPQADGIVALTGGADRVETALRLLAAGRAGKLLLSGIGGNAELATLAHRAGIDPLPIAARVTLGRNATTTRGNADETAAWARENAIRSLIVVTAGYHMPRALAEIGRAAPNLTLYPMPVTPRPLREAGTAQGLRLIAEEYVKFLAATLDLTALLPPRGRPDLPHDPKPREDAAHQDSARAAGGHAG
jgi:uncharacterized SAM-binding protein YcdF (DUF218 family)